MKLSAIKANVGRDEEGYTAAIKDPSGDPYVGSDGETECTLTVIGKQSKAFLKAEAIETEKLINRGRRKSTAEEARERRMNLAVAGVIGMGAWEDEDGNPMPYSKANVRTLLASDDRILEQAEELIEHHSAFLSKRATS